MLGDIATTTLNLGTTVIATSTFWLGAPLTATRGDAEATIPLDLWTVPHLSGRYPENAIFRTTF